MRESAKVRKVRNLPSNAAHESVPRAQEPLPAEPAGELLPAIGADGKITVSRSSDMFKEATGAASEALASHLFSQAACGTGQKALEINVDRKKLGTFAEIGAGQEVARWFFHVGRAAGTVAKSISAYDMAVSDSLYEEKTRNGI